jgi:drug/metabolite transporter (DMT)-like permease
MSGRTRCTYTRTRRTQVARKQAELQRKTRFMRIVRVPTRSKGQPNKFGRPAVPRYMNVSTPTRRAQVIASLLVLTGSVCFAGKAVLVKLAYRYNIDPVSLLALRMAFALPFFLLIADHARRKARAAQAPPLTRREWLQIIGLGLLGYYLASLFDFWGLQYISAGLERLVLFTYPTLVIVIGFLFLRKRIQKRQLLALVLTYLGIGVAFIDHLLKEENRDALLGGVLVFVSALVFALYLLGGTTMIARLGTQRFTALALTAAGVAILIQHGVFYRWQLFHYPAEVYILSLVMAIFSTVLPSFMTSEGLRVIGPGNTAIISSFSPVAVVILARIFLGEHFGWWQWVGTALVIGGVLLTTLKRS